jgi:hypothetical protein
VWKRPSSDIVPRTRMKRFVYLSEGILLGKDEGGFKSVRASIFKKLTLAPTPDGIREIVRFRDAFAWLA